MIKQCASYRYYKGIREPRCCRGEGCQACWHKYLLEESKRNGIETLSGDASSSTGAESPDEPTGDREPTAETQAAIEESRAPSSASENPLDNRGSLAPNYCRSAQHVFVSSAFSGIKRCAVCGAPKIELNLL